VKKFDIFVIRIDRASTNLINARPCVKCLDMMKSLGINRVYYSNDLGEIVCENVRDMISIHTSIVSINIDTNGTGNGTVLKQKEHYLDQLIRTKIPNTVKISNFNKFMIYDFKTLEPKYHVIKFIAKTQLCAQILNGINIIKTIYLID
jgi:hypothetical protein